MGYKGMNFFRFSGIILLAASFFICSCRPQSAASKSMDKINATKAAKAKEVQEQYDKALKRHKKIQTKEVRKRMENTRKKAGKWTKKNIGNVPNCPVVK